MLLELMSKNYCIWQSQIRPFYISYVSHWHLVGRYYTNKAFCVLLYEIFRGIKVNNELNKHSKEKERFGEPPLTPVAQQLTVGKASIRYFQVCRKRTTHLKYKYDWTGKTFSKNKNLKCMRRLKNNPKVWNLLPGYEFQYLNEWNLLFCTEESLSTEKYEISRFQFMPYYFFFF